MYYGWQNVYKMPNTLNAQQFMAITDETNFNNGVPALNWQTQLGEYTWNMLQNGWQGTNWLKYAEGYPGRFYHAEAYGVNPETFRTDPEIIRQRTLDGAKILAERLLADDVKANGISVLTGGTDVHLVMVDLRNSEMDGQQGEDLLAACGITINRNTVPFDPRPASVASGLRIGTSALATRGFGPKEYEEVADIIGTALAAGPSADVTALKARVDKLAEDFPLYPDLDQIH